MRIQRYSRFMVNSIVLLSLVAAGRPGFAPSPDPPRTGLVTYDAKYPDSAIRSAEESG
jgi:hypothetical protein